MSRLLWEFATEFVDEARIVVFCTGRDETFSFVILAITRAFLFFSC